MIFRLSLSHLGALALVGSCLLFVNQPVEAKKKRLNDKILKEAMDLGKDREKKFAGEQALSLIHI